MNRIPTRLDRWRESRTGAILGEILGFLAFAVARFYRLRGMQAAGALTFTTLLALVPLLAIVFAIFSAFPAFEDVRASVEAVIFENMIPEVGGVMREHLQSFLTNTSKLGGVGIIALGVSALMLLSTIETTFNLVWRVERPRPLLNRLLIFWMVLTLGPLLIGATVSLTSDLALMTRELASEAGLDPEALTPRNAWLERGLALILQTIGFSLLYMMVPNRYVQWRDAVIGGASAAFFFECLKTGFSLYFANVQTYQTIYGAMAAVPIFLIWLYMSWMVILVGAVLAAAFPEWWRSRDPSAATEVPKEALLAACLTVLAAVREEMRTGRSPTPALVTELEEPDSASLALGQLEKLGYLRDTVEGGLLPGRDLSTTTLYDLHADLGMATEIKDETLPPPLGKRLRELAASERETLRVPLSEILDEIR